MKKIVVMLLIGLVLSVAAGCGGNKNDAQKPQNEVTEQNQDENEAEVSEEGEAEVPEEGEAEVPEEGEAEVPDNAGEGEDLENEVAEETGTGAVAILETVWASYGDDEKFPIGGGDSTNMTMDVPGAFDATNSEELDVTLGFPAAQTALIDDAASVMHMMNANNFTCGIYHVTDAANASTLADALKENIMSRQWMCGMPEKLIIATVGEDYVLSAFGLGENMDVFKNKLTAAYADTAIIYEEAITE